MLYMTGLPLSLWDSEHEHNTVNMWCSLKKNCHITNPTSPQRPPLYKGHFLLYERWATVERFNCTQNVRNINALISQ